jgi:hypothetical protein
MRAIAILTLTVVFLISCNQPGGVSPSKSASVNVLLSTSAKTPAGGRLGGIITTANGSLDVSSFVVSMANVRIEENSGNDVQQGGGSDTNDGSPEGTSTPEGSDQSDIILAGPFTVDAVSGTVSLQKVDVFPGIFKKVDFSLLPQAAAPLNGGSIVVKGNFKSGTSTTPFTIQSSLTSYIQLPLQGNGITVKDKGAVTVTILVDVAALLNNLDLSGATVANGEILVDATANSALLKIFETNFAKFTEASQ